MATLQQPAAHSAADLWSIVVTTAAAALGTARVLHAMTDGDVFDVFDEDDAL